MKKTAMMVVLLACATILTSAYPSAAAEKVRIAVANFNVTFLPAGVAANRGFFRDEGLDVEVIRVSPPVSIAALMGGDIDYVMVLGSSVRAAMRGLPVKVLANFIDALTFGLVAQPGIKSVSELRGKTLGVGALGDSSDLTARIMIRHFGVEPDQEMKILGLGPDSARLATLREKLIDVAIVSPPADSLGKKMGFNVLARAHEIFRFAAIGLSTSDKKIKERPEEVKRVLKALVRANRFMRQDRLGTIQVLMDWAMVERESAVAAYDDSVAVFNKNDGTIPEDGLRLVLEQAKKEAKITREIPLTEIMNLNLLREAQKELRSRN
jgi:ABC-type nitrate/sulfonate/bicarbonate transport system substrate-binding protein